MHQGTTSSDAVRSVATTLAVVSILLSLHGIYTNSELFLVLVGGVDIFIFVYSFGILIAILVLLGIYFKNPRMEYMGMIFSTWFYTFLCLFVSIVTYLHSPIIVACFGIAMISAIIAAYIKKGRTDGKENFGSRPPRKD